jgi:hypothetical protein
MARALQPRASRTFGALPRSFHQRHGNSFFKTLWKTFHAFPDMSFFAEVLPAFSDAASAGEFKKFLAAMQAFLPFFDRMGSMFKMVKSDIGGNVDKLIAGSASAAPNITFAALIDADLAAGKNATTSGSNAESLLWLKRAMEFIM